MQAPVMSKGVEHPLDLSRIAQDLQIRKVQVESVVGLLDQANTVPFITRYRKEATGGLNEEIIRQIEARVRYLRQLAERKQTILKSIEGQGKLTDDLRSAILQADTSKRLEDLYLPYKPKKRTLATIARERGLEALAQAIWNRDPVAANLPEVVAALVNPEKELKTPDDVLSGVGHILAELIAETADVRAAVRVVLWDSGKLCTAKGENLPEGQGLEYKDYFQFTETIRHIPPHRILAINRGEKEGPLKVRLEWDVEGVHRATYSKLPLADHPHADFLTKVSDDALSRLLLPSLEREIRRELTEEAEDHAVRVFARNLRSLLLQPPLRGRRVLAIDPGFRTGCKVAALDEVGNLLEHTVIYPFGRGDRGKGKGKRGERLAGSPLAPVTANVTPSMPPEIPSTPAVPANPPETISPLIAEPSGPTPEGTAESNQPTDAAPSVAEASPLLEPGATAAGSFDTIITLTPLAPEMAPPAAVDCASPPAVSTEIAGIAPVSAPSASETNAGPSPGDEAKAKLEELVRKHQLHVIAIGNGTACRETEELVSELIAQCLPELAYVIVNEAGASVYSASAVGREEFPDYDATLRGTISIGRRLQDPLSELVKIDPQNIGVGLYQHDIHPRRLKESLDAVIESCVNHVGVDLNTASVPLLRHVSGLNQLVARELVDYRKQNGPFKNREQLMQVPSVGQNRFVQAAGFLKIACGDNPLDQTWIHPESYPVAKRLLAELACGEEFLQEKQKSEELRDKLKALSVEEMSGRLEIGSPTLRDIFDALARPGRDPREDLPPPVFKKGILKLEDLQPGMELKGTVLNVVDFGAFVDIGLKDSGLVHISQMANRYIRNPYELVAVGDVVAIWVLSVDHERRRVSLTMIQPGTQRRAPEKKAQPPQPQRGNQPPRGRRPPPPRRQQTAVPNQGQAATGGAAAPAVQQDAQQPAAAATSAVTPAPRQPAAGSAPPPRPVLRSRRPYRAAPKPKLSKAALEGAAPLRTFSELKAFFEAQQEVPKPAPEQTGNEPAHTPS